MLLQGRDDFHAQVDRITLVLLFVVEIGEGHGAVAHTEGDGTGFLDLGQGAGQFLSLDWRHAADDTDAEQRGEDFGQFHKFSWADKPDGLRTKQLWCRRHHWN
ncbi:hypothetical protein D3C72_1554640 [compost metagenome]